MTDQKQSQFTEVTTVTDNDYFPVFGGQTNEKITKKNLFSQIKDETQIFIYPTVALLQGAPLIADSEWPIYARIEENGYRLYKITSLAAGANDISLSNGTTATFQPESTSAFSLWSNGVIYNISDNAFVTGSNGNYYQSIQNPNLGKDPTTQAAYWTQIYFLPTWNANFSYPVNAIAMYLGRLYRCNTAPNINHVPPNASYWDNLTFNNSLNSDFTITYNSYAPSVAGSHPGLKLNGSFGCGVELQDGTYLNGWYNLNGASVFYTAVTAGNATSLKTALALGANQTVLVGTTTENISGAKYGALQLRETATSGIYLGNTDNPARSVIDWYDEIISFLPTYGGTTTAGVTTYVTQAGSYTRIGNRIFGEIFLSWSAAIDTVDGVSNNPNPVSDVPSSERMSWK